MKSFKLASLSVAISTVSLLGFSNHVFSQEESTGPIEEMVLTGTRGKPRTVSDSPVPIDVFNAEDLKSVSYTDTNDIIQTLVPSYSVGRVPIGDGATFIRPASLRGMPTDKTLVLVNGKRRHRSALVQIGGSGTQGPDIATIPAAALKGVEVLRDGAASLYGSDAIAGVINFQLKDNDQGGSLNIDFGEQYEGDGEQYTISGNIGMPLGDGFLSISGEVSSQDFTSRSEQYCQSWFCVTDQSEEFQALAQNASLEGDVVQPWGQPNAKAKRLFFNAAIPLGDATELYSYGSYSDSEGDGSFFYRYPGNSVMRDLRLADGSIYNPVEIFPGGFTPRFSGDVADYSWVTGLKGEFSEGFVFDFTARYGFDEIDYTIVNTINPSMGPDTPTEFDPGALSNEEIQVQADFTYDLTDATTLAFGASYMDESYDVQQGGDLSFFAGPYANADPHNLCADDLTPTAAGLAAIGNGSTLDCADTSDPVYQQVAVGSNGFPGFDPLFSEVYERDSFGVYAELSSEVTDALFVQGSLRYEDYSDFDSEVVGQLAAKFDITDSFGIRSSVGTGFRAPTPGQQGTTNVSTRLPNGTPIASGLFPAGGEVAQALGSTELKPETSFNMTFGFTAELASTSLTVDFYRIAVEDRTYAVSSLGVSTDPSAGADYDRYLSLVEAGVSSAATIGEVRYFTNAFDSVTSGVDVVVSSPIEWGDAGTTTLTASVNYNKSELDSDASDFLNAEDSFDFENDRPNVRGVLTAKHEVSDFQVLTRASYFGSYKDSNGTSSEDPTQPNAIQTYGSEVFIDLEATYQFTSLLSATIGGRNIFDEYPDKVDTTVGDYCCGRVYSSNTIVPWQGGYYFVRLDAAF